MAESTMMPDIFTDDSKILNSDEINQLQLQDSRLVSDHKAKMLEVDARKHWDLFYKRNENRFFKDRHWTTREFKELLQSDTTVQKVLFEIGCGAGNLIFPLIEEKFNFFIHACDFSQRAVDLVKSHKLYNEDTVHAFQTDITLDDVHSNINESSIDVATLIFVLSAIHPNKFNNVATNIYRLLKPGGILLFRDYGLYDMAQLRFKPGHKIAEKFYMRQDGTRSYYFSTSELQSIFIEAKFEVISNNYVHRRTINRKEEIDVPRIYVQAKFKKSQ